MIHYVLLLISSMFLSSHAMAENEGWEVIEGGRRNACQNQYNPNSCRQVPGCFWDQRYRVCKGQSNVPPPNNSCQRWNGNPNACARQYGCNYDFNYRVCYSAAPSYQCDQIFDVGQCSNTPGCYYDYNYRRCLRQTGGQPGPRIGWCAGGPRQPSYALNSQQEARYCAQQIARYGGLCAQAARYGRCDLTHAYPGWQANPNVPRCSCVPDSNQPGNFVNWYGQPSFP